jgi:hypothetical protein
MKWEVVFIGKKAQIVVTHTRKIKSKILNLFLASFLFLETNISLFLKEKEHCKILSKK